MHHFWVERVIQDAQEDGVFDNVAGAGMPIPDLARPYDPGWWARNWIAREKRRSEAADLIRDVERELPLLLAETVTDEVRAGLESLNARIKRHNATSAQSENLPLLDVESLMMGRAARRTR